jgi:redox-sensing transcriptional repressor
MQRISDSTVRRLSSYLRALDDFSFEGQPLISSRDLALLTGVTSAQVRKDLSYLGSLGQRGLGYMVEPLRKEIRAVLGLSRHWLLALVGAGNIGTALVSYEEFNQQGFKIVAVFDNSPDRIGHRLGGHMIEPVDRFPEVCNELSVEIGVIATPAQDAQAVADVMVTAGLRAVLSFAPRELHLPEHVMLRAVNMTHELESLSFMLNQGGTRAPSRRSPSLE